MKKYCGFFLLLFTIFGTAQQLRLEDIMKGDEFIGHQPSNHRWSIDGQTVLFDWNPNNEIGNSPYFWNKSSKSPQKVSSPNPVYDVDFIAAQKDFEVVYYTNQGVLYAYTKSTKKTKKIIQSADRISAVQRSTTPDIVFFQQNRNVYQFNTKDFSMVMLTNFKSGKENKAKEEDSFLKDQQKELFQFVRDEAKADDWYAAQSKSKKEKFPKEIFYDKSQVEQVKASPDGKFVTFRLSDYPTETPTNVANFITDDGFTQSDKARAKVSTANFSKHKFGIFNVEKDTTYYVSFANLSGIKDAPKYYQDYVNLKDKSDYETAIVMMSPVYSQDGKNAVLEIRSQDNKHRWIVQLDLVSGKTTELEHQHDEAWIGGPGISSYSFSGGTVGFIDNSTIYFQSEVTGFSHVYTYNLNNKKKEALTNGNWEVREVTLSNDKKGFYITTTTTHPGNRSFYKLDIASKKMTRILTNDGNYEVKVSPDEKTLLVRYSYKNKPWELFVGANKPNADLNQITFSTTDEFKKYNWKTPEVITFKAEDGTIVYARLYQPKSENKNKAAVIFVHGAGYLQNAHNYWSTYHREYMFHNLLTDLGYTVLDIDYRASDGYGRDFRTGIYRHMGGKDLSDQLDGKNYLVQNLGIDANRVGMYGGSYGGFITLMALLTKPGEFKAGAALRSVTDWAHYNHGYTSNILNFPETDPEAYKKSSPIYFANNLQDKLLMLHGMVDDNVQFQDIVRLTQRFIELGKKDWDLAVFPVEAHGFKRTYSWVDEYRRILALFNQNLLQK
ncbi:prolyl oligopeptidase family serine peptidase [Flavobacterium sp.]|jgi:dipeptidyl aminopeptidase/acylaminoacyl peptidase|uniref:S9 family peptidase n=1 Tax=Flavobacterium sp. TaxID=239 RepID=UPI0037BE8436